MDHKDSVSLQKAFSDAMNLLFRNLGTRLAQIQTDLDKIKHTHTNRFNIVSFRQFHKRNDL